MSTVPNPGLKTYRIPRLIIENGSLKHLSGNALSLFLIVSHRCYRTRKPEVQYSFREIFFELDMRAQDAKFAVKELRDAGLVCFQQDKSVLSIQIRECDGSKAKSYLRDPPTPQIEVASVPSAGTSAVTIQA